MGITERFRRKCNGSTPQLQHAGLGDKSDIAHRKAGQQAALGGGAARNQPQLRPGGRVGLITPGEPAGQKLPNFWRQTGGFEMVLITADGRLLYTPGLAEKITTPEEGRYAAAAIDA